MAVTWAASAPHADAAKHVGVSYGVVGVVAVLPNEGGRRRVRTKVAATGTYTTGGDAFSPAAVGLREVHRAFLVANAAANVRPVIDGITLSGVPAFDLTVAIAPKIQYFDDGVEATAGQTLTGDTFHVVFEGV